HPDDHARRGIDRHARRGDGQLEAERVAVGVGGRGVIAVALGDGGVGRRGAGEVRRPVVCRGGRGVAEVEAGADVAGGEGNVVTGRRGRLFPAWLALFGDQVAAGRQAGQGVGAVGRCRGEDLAGVELAVVV